jgi:hypothetical protein
MRRGLQGQHHICSVFSMLPHDRQLMDRSCTPAVLIAEYAWLAVLLQVQHRKLWASTARLFNHPK